MRLLACQVDTAWEDERSNFDRVRGLLDSPAVSPGSLVALPEMFATGFSMDTERLRESPAGETDAFLASEAARRGIFLVGGLVSLDALGARNQAVAFSPMGEELCRYSKMHLFSPAGEPQHYVPGTKIALFQVGGLRAAAFVCYDLRFPEGFREAARLGAELFVVIANWPDARAHHWRSLLVTRAIENQSFVMGVNRVGRDPNATYAGGSLVVSPRGEILAEGGGEEGPVWADVDPAEVFEYRREFPALRDAFGAAVAGRRTIEQPEPGIVDRRTVR